MYQILKKLLKISLKFNFFQNRQIQFSFIFIFSTFVSNRALPILICLFQLDLRLFNIVILILTVKLILHYARWKFLIKTELYDTSFCVIYDVVPFRFDFFESWLFFLCMRSSLRLACLIDKSALISPASEALNPIWIPIVSWFVILLRPTNVNWMENAIVRSWKCHCYDKMSSTKREKYSITINYLPPARLHEVPCETRQFWLWLVT